MDQTEIFEAERPRLLGIATRVLGDHAEAEDVVQQGWLRLDRAVSRDATEIDNLPAWLTTVTTRLCLDRLRARTPVPVEDIDVDDTAPDPADDVALADTVGIALQAVIDRLSPRERVAFVLHDSFGFEFGTIAAVLDTTPAAARKLASRARSKVTQPTPEDALADWEVVDAFFNGSAHSALSVFVGERPASAWFLRGEAKVVFDFTVDHGRVTAITFRADPAVLARVVRRSAPRGGSGHTCGP